jgi:DNA-binding NtrC family response regulator
MSESNKKSILVVDDEEIIREFLYEVLCEDFQITLAGDGDEAIDKLSQAEFDLVITDLKMPRISGEEVVKYAKSRNAKCPVIVISGYSSLFAASESVNHGACAFLSKPFSIVELTKAIDQCLKEQAA